MAMRNFFIGLILIIIGVVIFIRTIDKAAQMYKISKLKRDTIGVISIAKW
jgi:hypothetical protein